MPFDEFLRTRLFEPLGMKDTAFYVPQEKCRASRSCTTSRTAGGPEVDENRHDPTVVPPGPSGGGGLFSTARDYARFCEMLLKGGQLNGVRLLAPRTVEMMRTNHVNPEPLKTMARGPAGAWTSRWSWMPQPRASQLERLFHWYGIAGTWFWIDPVEDLRVHRHAADQNLGIRTRCTVWPATSCIRRSLD